MPGAVFAAGAPGQVYRHAKSYKHFSITASSDIARAHPLTSANARHNIRVEARRKAERERAAGSTGEEMTDAEFMRLLQENERAALAEHKEQRSERIRAARARIVGQAADSVVVGGHKCPKCGMRVPPQRMCCLACGFPVQPGDRALSKAFGAATRLTPLVGPQPALNDVYNSGVLSQELISAQEKKRLIKADVFLGGGIEKHKRRPKRPQDAFRLDEADISAAYRKHIRLPPNRFELPTSEGAKGENEPPKAPAGAPTMARARKRTGADDGGAATAQSKNVAEHGAMMAQAAQQHAEEEENAREAQLKQPRAKRWLRRFAGGVAREATAQSATLVPFAAGGARSRDYALVRRAQGVPASIRARRENGGAQTGAGATKAPAARTRRVFQFLGKRLADKALGRSSSLFTGLLSAPSLEPEDLFRAIEAGDLDDVKYCLAGGVSVLSHNFEQRTPLHVACAQGNTAIARILLAQQLGRAAQDAVNAVDGAPGRQCTPLHEAVQAGSAELVALLLSHGANPDARCASRKTALMLAAKTGNVTIMELLLGDAANARIDLRDTNGMRALHHAAQKGSESAVRLLLEVGSAPRDVDKFGRTASEHARLSGRRRLCDMLRSVNLSVDPKKVVNFTYENMGLTGEGQRDADDGTIDFV